MIKNGCHELKLSKKKHDIDLLHILLSWAIIHIVTSY